MPPLRICLIAPVPPPYGGIGHWTAMVLRHAVSRPDVRIGVVDTSPRWRAIDDLAAWKRILGGGAQLLRDFARFLRQVFRCPDVVHLTTSGQLATFRDLLILRTAGLLRIPVVYHIRFGRIPALADGDSGEWKRLSQAMRLAHTVLTIDRASEHAIRARLPGVPVVSIPNCYEADRLSQFETTNKDPRTAIFIGWMLRSKGIEELIQAWHTLNPDGWTLRLIGPGTRDYMAGLLAQYPCRSIEFLGEQPHAIAMRHLSRAELFVFPSHTEGFPNVVLEAMRLGTPVVASAVGAIPEMLENHCGVLVPPRQVEPLVAALSALLANSRNRLEMGERARQQAIGRYSLEAVFPQYLSVWRQAAGLPR